MSWQASGWAIEKTTGSPATKSVLLAIANYAQARGETFQKISTLARDTEQSENSVRRHLVRLEELGLLGRAERWHESGRRIEDWMVLLINDESHAFLDEARHKGKRGGQKGESDSENPVQNAKSSEKEHQENAGVRPTNLGGQPSHSCGRATLPTVVGLLRNNGPIKESPSPSETPVQTEREEFENDFPVSAPGDEGSDWEKFYKLWAWREPESPTIAKGCFRDLPAEQRKLALRHAPAYLRECRDKGRKQAYAGNWLKQRGFEEFERRKDAAVGAEEKLFEAQRAKYGGNIVIREGTQEFAAWSRYEREVNGVAKLDVNRFGPWLGALRPAKWPPKKTSPPAAP